MPIWIMCLSFSLPDYKIAISIELEPMRPHWWTESKKGAKSSNQKSLSTQTLERLAQKDGKVLLSRQNCYLRTDPCTVLYNFKIRCTTFPNYTSPDCKALKS